MKPSPVVAVREMAWIPPFAIPPPRPVPINEFVDSTPPTAEPPALTQIPVDSKEVSKPPGVAPISTVGSADQDAVVVDSGGSFLPTPNDPPAPVHIAIDEPAIEETPLPEPPIYARSADPPTVVAEGNELPSIYEIPSEPPNELQIERQVESKIVGSLYQPENFPDRLAPPERGPAAPATPAAPPRIHAALTAPIPTDVELPKNNVYALTSMVESDPQEPAKLDVDHSQVAPADFQSAVSLDASIADYVPAISQWTEPERIESTLKTMFLLTIVSLAPAVLLMTTSFIRISVVLSLLRQALGTQMLPSNQMVTSLSLFLSLLVMLPTWKAVYDQAIVPYTSGETAMTAEQAWQAGVEPIRKFMSNQIERANNTEDVMLFYDYLPNSGGTPGIL